MPETIDITPRWADLLPLFVAVLQDGNEEGRAAVSSELRRMAAAADRWNETADPMLALIDDLDQLIEDDEPKSANRVLRQMRGLIRNEKPDGGQS
jgi:hypothetical protein